MLDKLWYLLMEGLVLVTRLSSISTSELVAELTVEGQRLLDSLISVRILNWTNQKVEDRSNVSSALCDNQWRTE